MTEGPIAEFFDALEGLAAGIVQRAGDIAEDARTVDAIRDDMAEWMLAASKGIPISDKVIAKMRIRLADLLARLQQRGLDEASAAEGLTRVIGSARATAVTVEIDVAELARANAQDSKP